MMTDMDFPQKLTQLMEAAGLNMPELAKKSGVGYDTVYGYVNGRRKPSLENSIKLAQAMGVDAGVFADCTFVNEPQVPTGAPARRTGRPMAGKPKRPRAG